jgi:hypothetical protein
MTHKRNNDCFWVALEMGLFSQIFGRPAIPLKTARNLSLGCNVG